ncbi:MAG: hypothetical protein H6906_01280 [Hyphomicrobiales bacterium]|nr:hypothetical protein [Hyphomicrobiales bacterium]
MIWFLLGVILAAVSALLVVDHEMGGLDSVVTFLQTMPGGVGALIGAFFGTLIGIGLWLETARPAAPAVAGGPARPDTPAPAAGDRSPSPNQGKGKGAARLEVTGDPAPVCRAAEIEKANEKWRREERAERLRDRHAAEEARARERRTLASALIHEVSALARALEDRVEVYRSHDKNAKKAVVPRLLLPEARVFAANAHIIAGMDSETAGALAGLNVALQDAVQVVEFRANDEIVQIKASEVVDILDGLLKQAREVRGLLELSLKEASVPLNLNSVA